MPAATTNPTDNVTNGWVQAPFDISSTIANPDGNPVNAEITPTTNEVIPSSDITPSWALPQAPATSADAANNVIAASQNIAANAQSEAASQIQLTNELSQVDKVQAETKVANAESNFKEAEKIQTNQMIQKNQNEIEYQKQLQDENSAEIANLKMIQASENALNAATAAEMKLKADNAERDAEIANDVAQQTSAIAFAKLWLSFSWAAINTSQQIYAQGARGIAELRSSNAKNYADLRVKIDSVAFNHQATINKVVADAHEKEFSSKERLREFIGNAQNNILSSKKEAQSAIQDAISTYKTERQAREDKLYSDIGAANKDLLTVTQTIQATVLAKQEVVKKEIDSLIANGQWSSLSTAQQTEKELAAGLPVNSVNRTTTTNITAWINARLKELVWSVVEIPRMVLDRMQADIQSYMKYGYPMVTAIQMSVNKYKSTIPDVAKLEAAALNKTKLVNAKTQAEIDKLNSEATENLASVAKMKADAARAASARAASAWASAAKSTLEYKATVTWPDGKTYDQMWNKWTQKMEYVPTAVNINWKIWTTNSTSTWKEELEWWVLKNVEYKPDGTRVIRWDAKVSSKNADTSVQTIKEWDKVNRILIDNATWNPIKTIWEAWAPLNAEAAAIISEWNKL